MLKALTGKSFKEAQIHEAAREHNHVIPTSKSRFYDTASNTWPIKKTIMLEDGSNAHTDIPLLEHELLAEQLTEARCIFIKVDYINALRQSVESSALHEVDYTTIVVKSTNPEIGEYNFFDALTKDGWFGYRTLGQSTFRAFCGFTNKMLIDSPTTDKNIVQDVENEVNLCGFRSIQYCFQPEPGRLKSWQRRIWPSFR